MRIPLLLAVLLAASTPAFGAGGSLFLAWNDCYGETGANWNLCFDCTGAAGVHSLYASYRLNTDAPGVLSLDATLDFRIPGYAEVPAFWQVWGGGCNDGFLVFKDEREAGRCAGDATTLCMTNGGQCFSGAIASAPGGFPGWTGILVSITRSSTSPVTLAAGRHYGFQLDIDASNALEAGGTCAGCVAAADLCLRTILLSGAAGHVDAIACDMPGSLADVTANYWGCTVSARAKTWGQLKALYR